MKTVKTRLIVLPVLTLFLLIGCDNPTDSPPTSGTISGTVTFPIPAGETINDLWPANDKVTIAIYLSWPPTVPADTTDFTIEELVEENKYNYTFNDLIFTTYQGISVTWKDPEDSLAHTQHHILGTYGGSYCFMPDYCNGNGTNPTAVTVSETNASITGLEFSADLKYVTACSKIEHQTECTNQQNVDNVNYCTWYSAGNPYSIPEGCY